MTDKHTLVERLGAGWCGSSLNMEAATRITALEAREAELVERLTRLRDAAENCAWSVNTSMMDVAIAEASTTLAKARQSDEGEA